MNPDFRDMLRALSEEGVEYLLVGAYALASHGSTRTTGDIDVWIRRSPENSGRVWRSLKGRVWRSLTRFGAPMLGLTQADLEIPDIVFQIGIAPRRIDLLTSIAGVEFDQAWPNRIVVDVAGIAVPTIGRNELLLNKKSTGRPKDLADAVWLEQRP